jgi:hypothetical protein
MTFLMLGWMVLMTETEQPLHVEACSQMMGYSFTASWSAAASLSGKSSMSVRAAGMATAQRTKSLREIPCGGDIAWSFHVKWGKTIDAGRRVRREESKKARELLRTCMADKCRSEYPKIIAHCRRVNVKKLNTGRLKNPPEELAGSELRVGCGRGILSRRVQIRYNPITRI